MRSKVKSLFLANNYIFKEIKSGDLYSLNAETSNGANMFWHVVELDNVIDIIEKQTELYEECVERITSKHSNKNLSMIILKKISTKAEIDELKNDILKIEEDPFLFKKHVLYYSDVELAELENELKEMAFNDFIKTKSAESTCFEKYKADPFALNWQSFIYRILLKIPFLNIGITPSIGLLSLFEKNDAILISKSLKDDSDMFLTFLDNKEINDLSELELLQKIIEYPKA